MKKPKVGLLPFYIKLYDDTSPESRPLMEQNKNVVCAALEKAGLEVHSAPICCVRSEFEAAVRGFEKSGVDAVVTLHLAYSPSLESIDALCTISVPIIVLDTTPTFDFAERQNAGDVMENHGIHGVQDMCNMLIRREKDFYIEVGHLTESDVIERIYKRACAACAANAYKTARVGIIGKPFEGMGDFMVTPEYYKSSIGATVVPFDFGSAGKYMKSITNDEIKEEIKYDKERFTIEAEEDADYYETVKACLMVRKWIEQEKLTAWTACFLEITSDSGIPRMPFIEASKGMASGIGYAGEGDTLTAGLVGALLSAGYETTFAEMFCPGWSDDSIFLSHMGEVNLALCTGSPVLAKKPFDYTDAGDPVAIYGRLKYGDAVFVDLAPRKSGYALILSSIKMMNIGGGQSMSKTVEGWFKPELPINEFLKKYSCAGGTHHGAVVYGVCVDDLAVFGKMMGFEVVII